MVLPTSISQPSPLDPLLLLPLPKSLPASPAGDLDPLLSAVDAHLDPSSPMPSYPIALLTSHMRQITRRTQILMNAARVGAAEARQELDQADVDLRGVEYERDRVRDEIERCEDYEPVFRELDLPSAESFLEHAGDEKLDLPDGQDEGYQYALTIARLQNELEEIEKGEAQLAQLTKERDGLIKAKKEIKQKFDAIDVYLTDFAKTSNAVATKIRDVVKLPTPPA